MTAVDMRVLADQQVYEERLRHLVEATERHDAAARRNDESFRVLVRGREEIERGQRELEARRARFEDEVKAAAGERWGAEKRALEVALNEARTKLADQVAAEHACQERARAAMGF